MGREFDGILRHSFLVDPSGKLAKVYTKVKPAEHAAEVLADVRALGGGAAKAPRSRQSKAPRVSKKPARKKGAARKKKAPARKNKASGAKKGARRR